MKMTKFEKRFVNRRKKAEKNIEKVEDNLRQISNKNIKDVLEIGCGIGLVSAWLADKYGLNVYGIDIDPEEIKIAKEINKERHRLHYRIEDAGRLSFENNSFDLVISQNVFHHIPNWPNVVAELKRTLRPSRYLVWLDLVFPSLVKKIFKPITKNYGLYTFKDIELEFKKAGFITIQKQKMAHGPFKHYEMLMTT